MDCQTKHSFVYFNMIIVWKSLNIFYQIIPIESSEVKTVFCIWAMTSQNQKMSVRWAKTKIGLGIRPAWSEYLLCAQWLTMDLICLHANSGDSDQTNLLYRLTWVYSWRTFTTLVFHFCLSLDQNMNIMQKSIECYGLTLRKHMGSSHEQFRLNPRYSHMPIVRMQPVVSALQTIKLARLSTTFISYIFLIANCYTRCWSAISVLPKTGIEYSDQTELMSRLIWVRLLVFSCRGCSCPVEI